MDIFDFAPKKDEYTLFPNFGFEKKTDKYLVFFTENVTKKLIIS